MAEANDALINKATMIAITDKLGGIYDALLAALETATTGCQALAGDILETIMAITSVDEYYVKSDLLAPSKTLGENLETDRQMQLATQSFLQSLNQHCSQRGSTESSTISSIDTFATYWNTAGFTDMLFSPSFRALYYQVFGSYPTAGNCYAPDITHGATYSNGMAKWVGGAVPVFTDGAAVEQSGGSYIYAGLRPMLHVEAGGLSASAGTIEVVVTGVGWNGSALAETTWTYTSVGNSIAAGDYELTDLGGEGADETIWIRDVKAIAGIVVTNSEAGQVDGTCYVHGIGPDGRP